LIKSFPEGNVFLFFRELSLFFHTTHGDQVEILFVNPNRMLPPVAPLAADYLCEALTVHGHICKVLDLCLEGPAEMLPTPEWARQAVSSTPDVVLLTMRNLDDAYYFSRDSFLEPIGSMVQLLKEAFGKPVIMGGSGFSIAPEALLPFLQADYGIAGSSEQDLLGLLASTHDPDSFEALPGLVWSQDGRIRSNAPSVQEMAQDFYSPRRFISNRSYAQQGGMVGLETKRGCPEPCRYCVDPLGKGSRVVTKPIPALLREVRSLMDQEASIFHLCDSEFNVPKRHALTVCKAVREEGLSDRIRWYTYANPLGFDDELAFSMAEAGCAGINFGVDHSVQEVLQPLGRTHTEEDLRRTAQACQRAGLTFLFDLLLGGPGETMDTLREVIELCRSLDVPNVGANVGIRLYPNTPLAAEILGQGPMAENPSLAGRLEQNDQLLYPVFYCSHELGETWQVQLEQFIGDDPRFFLPIRERDKANYNYNANEVLVDALASGHRGAFWDILSRSRRGLPPLQRPV